MWFMRPMQRQNLTQSEILSISPCHIYLGSSKIKSSWQTQRAFKSIDHLSPNLSVMKRLMPDPFSPRLTQGKVLFLCSNFYRTRVRSLVTLVSDSLTHSCLVLYFIDAKECIDDRFWTWTFVKILKVNFFQDFEKQIDVI